MKGRRHRGANAAVCEGGFDEVLGDFLFASKGLLKKPGLFFVNPLVWDFWGLCGSWWMFFFPFYGGSLGESGGFSMC